MVFLALDFVPYIIVIAVGAFLIGLIKYVSHGDNEEKRAEGNKMIVYGLLGFFFMVSIWGILEIFTGSFNIPLKTPQFKEDTSKMYNKGCSRQTQNSLQQNFGIIPKNRGFLPLLFLGSNRRF